MIRVDGKVGWSQIQGRKTPLGGKPVGVCKRVETRGGSSGETYLYYFMSPLLWV